MPSALLFPGQGSQEPGMGRDLAEADRDCMELWKKAEKVSGIELRAIYWEGSENDMAQTRNLQPALTVVNINLWRMLAGKMKPVAAAGHSLGEFSALAASGVLPENILLELVALRGRLMSEADPGGKGAMAAVLRLTPEQVEFCVAASKAATGEEVLIANYNTPGQFVVSGGKGAIEHVQRKVKELKGRALALPVSGAFHSPLMSEAAGEFSKALDRVKSSDWSKARFAVYCNADPVPNTAPEKIKALVARQMVAPVRWIDTICRQWDDGCRFFVECGPKGVLSRMTGAILQEHAPASADHEQEAPAWQSVNVGNKKAAEVFTAWP